MFATTFYSYKGGVGRTMALANVASELSRRGKSVLVADFDLEAPGLSSFAFNGCEQGTGRAPGLIDFIHYWLDYGRTPDIREYVRKCEDDDPSHGPIFVMPSGRMDERYSVRLHQLDFDSLYREHDGFLLFEDIRAQWEKSLKVDYVLIDSRTGHTDIGGICTRQLPDLVVFVFWPNVQNLDGLSSIIQEIDGGNKEASRDVQKLFVPSNLPLLDDERDVLKGLLEKFRAALSYEPMDEVRIHNYASLELLEQKIFAREHPKSRLAREYRRLSNAIMSRNIVDPHGVRLFLRDALGERTKQPSRGSTWARQIESRLLQISSMKWEDSEINRLLALAKAREGDLIEAASRLEAVVAKGDDTLSDHRLLAEWLIAIGAVVDPLKTVNRLLDDDESTQAHVIAALRLLTRFDIPIPDDIEERAAIRNLSFRGFARISDSLNSERDQATLAARLIASEIRHGRLTLDTAEHSDIVSVSLALIAGGQFRDASLVLKAANPANIGQKLRIKFNSAMAVWGAEGKPPIELFEEFLELHETAVEKETPNYDQCVGLALALVGRSNEALEALTRARSLIEQFQAIFSCWSYLQRGELSFAHDIDEMRSWIATAEPAPAIFREFPVVNPEAAK